MNIKAIVIAVTAACVMAGCSWMGVNCTPYDDLYQDVIEGEITAERQMEIMNVLETNGWTHVGFHREYGKLYITAKRAEIRKVKVRTE